MNIVFIGGKGILEVMAVVLNSVNDSGDFHVCVHLSCIYIYIYIYIYMDIVFGGKEVFAVIAVVLMNSHDDSGDFDVYICRVYV